LRRVLASVAAVLALAACTGDDKPKAIPSPTLSTPGPVLPTTKPKVVVPKGPAPKALVKRDLIIGTGDFAVPGRTVQVNYVGVFFKDGTEFDSSWKTGPGNPLPFVVGNEDVIAGWDEGVVGMRVGGRRELVIPASLAYGADGDGSGLIGPDEPLVFVIDLVAVGGGFAPPVGTQGP
jgi:FKBP-type peptidyl-prolyl cis-trans isomerase